jgi:hypothetical protein
MMEQERAPLTEEQWDRLIEYYLLKGEPEGARACIAAREFQTSMAQIQSMAGHSSESFAEISRALLDMST